MNLKKTSKRKLTQSKEEINTEIMEKSKQKLEQRKKKGGEKIDNEDGYLKTIYDTEMKKITPTDTQIELDEWIDDFKGDIDNFVDDGKSSYTLILGIKTNDDYKKHYLTDDYKLTQNNYDWVTNSKEETLSKIKKWVDEERLIVGLEENRFIVTTDTPY